MRQVRQQVAEACWETKTGWPQYGVCLPSLYGVAGNKRPANIFLACCLITGRPFSSRIDLSLCPNRNLARKGRELKDISLCSITSLFINLLSQRGELSPSYFELE